MGLTFPFLRGADHEPGEPTFRLSSLLELNVDRDDGLWQLFGFGNFYYRDVLVLFAFLVGYLVLTILGVLLLLRERR